MIFDIGREDIITPVKSLFDKGTLHITPDGKIDLSSPMRFSDPWIITKPPVWHKCYYWHSIWFPYYGIIPSDCMNCWKVVARPRTLEELFKLYEIQVDLDVDCKCGIERREWVHGLYGGYFYNPSKEAGIERYRQVRQAVDERISPDVSVILKRACTEFEMKFGPSDKWVLSEEQVALEKRLNATYVTQKVRLETPDYLKAHIMSNWIKWAYACGDKTVMQYLDKPMYPSLVTYHEEL